MQIQLKDFDGAFIQAKALDKRKKEEGKKGFVAMNNVKNKLVQLVFAVVRSKQKYDVNFKHKLVA